MHRGEDETTLSSVFARRQHQKFDQTCNDCKSGTTSTGFRRTWLPRVNAAKCVQTQRSRLLMIRACDSMHSDRESVLESVCEVPSKHKHSLACRLSMLSQRIAGTRLDDCQLIDSGQQTFQLRLPDVVKFMIRVSLQQFVQTIL